MSLANIQESILKQIVADLRIELLRTEPNKSFTQAYLDIYVELITQFERLVKFTSGLNRSFHYALANLPKSEETLYKEAQHYINLLKLRYGLE